MGYLEHHPLIHQMADEKSPRNPFLQQSLSWSSIPSEKDRQMVSAQTIGETG